MAVVDGGSKTRLITCYAIGDDANVNYGGNTYLAQTFPIALITHLWRFRVKSWTSVAGEVYHYGLRNTNGAGKPTGADFAHTTLPPLGEVSYSPGKWRRFDFDEFPLVNPGTFAVVLSIPGFLDPSGWKARADTSAPTYTGGKAWKSTDLGVTWLELPNTDLMFEVWGYEPPPDAPPPPIVGDFAILSLVQTLTETGYQIVATTDKACHLFMRWTKLTPQKHIVMKEERGVYIGKGARYCFDVYHDNEQEEEGDTLEHTFIKEPWPGCETRWFYFFGYKQTELMPSESGIFEKHRPVLGFVLVLLEPWTLAIEPPEFTRLILEPWTFIPTEPTWTRIFLEEWTS